MSELIEKVARAMCADAGFDPEQVMPNDGPRWRYYQPQARAAIAAVAEWLDPKQMPSLLANTPAEIISARLRNELEQPK